MEASRVTIRSILKTVIDQENPELKAKALPVNKTRKQRTLQRLFIPMFGDSDSMTIITGLERMERVPEGDSDESSTRTPASEPENTDDGRHTSTNDSSSSPAAREDFSPSSLSVLQLKQSRSSSDDSDDPSDSSSSSSSLASMYHVPNTLFRAMASYDIGNLIPPLETTNSVSSSVFPTMTGASSSDSSVSQDDSSDASMDVDQPDEERSTIKHAPGAAPKRVHNKRKEAEMDEGDQSSNAVQSSSNASCASVSGDHSQSRKGQHSYSSKKKREKVDSGIGEDINNWEMSPSDAELASDSESEEDGPSKPKSDEKFTIVHGRPYRNASTPVRKAVRKAREGSVSMNQHTKPESSAYGLWMRSKIQQLPLPPSIKLYINHHREL